MQSSDVADTMAARGSVLSGQLGSHPMEVKLFVGGRLVKCNVSHHVGEEGVDTSSTLKSFCNAILPIPTSGPSGWEG